MRANMENKSNSKKRNVFQIILCIAVLALVVTVIVQSRSINSLEKVNSDASLAENIKPEPRMEASVIEEKRPAIQNKSDENKTSEPKLKVEDTKSRQVVLEDISKKDSEETVGIPISRQAGELLENLANEMQKNPAMESMMLN